MPHLGALRADRLEERGPKGQAREIELLEAVYFFLGGGGWGGVYVSDGDPIQPNQITAVRSKAPMPVGVLRDEEQQSILGHVEPPAHVDRLDRPAPLLKWMGERMNGWRVSPPPPNCARRNDSVQPTQPHIATTRPPPRRAAASRPSASGSSPA